MRGPFPEEILPFPEEILPWHTAILGKTGKGKSTTARDLVEQVVPTGSRVCILDTIKSDWWGITSSADGKKPGLPFTILGGPHAHLPLSRMMGKALGELVGSGALPHSIIDMADFGPGDPNHFFVDFAQALLKKMRGVLYLVIEEAHEIAPKERVGFAKENMGVYWAKKLATAGRSRGIRLVVLSQRTQALHNAVLGSCENLIVHGMTAPADKEPVVKWLKSNVQDKALRQQVEESMSSLPTGSAWLCSGEAKLFELRQFPRCKTYDNTATPTDDEDRKEVKTAPVDVAQLQTLLSTAVEEARANDPAALKRRIAELEALQRKVGPTLIPATVTVPIHCSVDHQALKNDGYQRGHEDGWAAGIKALQHKAVTLSQEATAAIAKAVTDKITQVDDYLLQRLYQSIYYQKPTIPAPDGVSIKDGVRTARRGNGSIEMHTLEKKVTREQVESALYGPSGSLTGVQQRIVDTIAELEQMGVNTPTSELIAIMAGYTNMRSKGYRNALSSLRSVGLLDGLILTPEGRAAAHVSPAPRSSEELQGQIINRLGGVSGRVLKPLIEIYPAAVDRDELGRLAGYENVRSKGFRNALSQLRTLGFIDYGSGNTVTAKSVLFLQ